MSGDTDVDVQCSLGALHRVKQYQNTIFEDRFMLIVNPNYIIRETRNKPDWKHDLGVESNVIDARWLDVLSGFFIDITAMSSEQSVDAESDVAPFKGDRVARCIQDKSPHKSNVTLINPQRRCRFEGMDLWCPNASEVLLKDEYEEYDDPHFHSWRFNQTIQTFQLITCQQLVTMYRQPTPSNCDNYCRQVVANERTLHYSRSENEDKCTLTVSWFEGQPAEKVQRTYEGISSAQDHFKPDLNRFGTVLAPVYVQH